ncbi:autotransporter domain-containing protein [Lysobacter sp. 5GHs7-4]|uniref:autotransporter domain-containing protein n=1 Tax=Lysobacter sp. 5GHs7-4 TaxID=2904253 RepID=UPI001E2D2E73|nr:autotransporter serine protease [Lysobacter sp. 5GHs7-4]UHQ21999.1 autotransporter domain-containing protein [Lysobacter sp. 5GHs7-4]
MQSSASATRTRRQNRQHARSALSSAILAGLLLGAVAPAMAQDAYQEGGVIGDAASWRSGEFKADWGLGAIGAEYAYARGLSGRGVRLGIFDSGSALAHSEFGGRDHRSIRISDPDCLASSAITGPNACFFSDGDTAEIDAYYLGDTIPPELSFGGSGIRLILEYGDHGTHVAGTMVANRDGNGMHGVATGASLTASKLFFNRIYEYYTGDDGIARRTLTQGPGEDALNSMFDQMAAQGVRAINHSWGNGTEPTTPEDMDLEYAAYPEYYRIFADASLRSGIINVWAAGNDYGNIAGAYATLPRFAPEIEKYWLSVVNVGRDLNLDVSSSICGLSKDWCVAAPGTDIHSTIIGGEIDGRVVKNPDGSYNLEIDGADTQYGYGDNTGTSMASPHVTGSLALLMERYPYLDNPQIRDVLLTTATDLGDEGVDEVYGWGLIDLKKAIDGPGQFRVDTEVAMNQRAGGAKVWEGDAWDDWSNDISGPGRLTKSGIGWLRLSGDNSFAGASVRQGRLELAGGNKLSGSLDVDGGDLLLTGQLTSTDLNVASGVARIEGGLHDLAFNVNGGWGLVAAGGVLENVTFAVNGGKVAFNGEQRGGSTLIGVGGVLGGTGTLGTTRVEGTIAPGNSIGTLTIDGDYTQAAGSFYQVELAAPSASDLLRVNGHASLLGGTVRVFQGPGTYLLGQRYDILSATSGIDGRFAGIDHSAFSPFLKFDLAYSADKVTVDVVRGASVASVANTYNQRSAAGAVDALAIGQGLVQPLTQLFPAQALDALDDLSGELHASTRSVLIDSSRHVREAALARAQAGQGAFDAAAKGEAESAAWIQLLKNGGTLHADGNAGEVGYNGDASLLGYDYRFGNGWRVGVLGGVGRSDAKLGERGSRGEIRSRHLGLYLGQNWGGFGLRAGASYARHEIEIERSVSFPGFSDRARADYDGDTRQVFVEGGYRIATGAWEWEPYAQYAQVRVGSDGFQESGGAAALSGASADQRLDLSTVGLRFNVGLKGAQQEQSWLNLRGGLGRRHAGGAETPAATVAWRNGGAFDVHGAPIAEDATVFEAGLAARLGDNGLLEFTYSGQWADEARDHAVNARYSLQF